MTLDRFARALHAADGEDLNVLGTVTS